MNNSISVPFDALSWRLSQPPWKPCLTMYQKVIITKLLVRALKSAPNSTEQHKIAFAIQEGLEILQSSFDKQGNLTVGDSISDKGDLNSVLVEELREEGVLDIIEPFWKTSYQQVSNFPS